MAYKDPKKQAEAQRRYREANLEKARKRERASQKSFREKHPEQAKKRDFESQQRIKARKLDVLPFRYDLDLDPEHARSCYHRFFTTNRCRERAVWRSKSNTKWCDKHAEGLLGLVPY